MTSTFLTGIRNLRSILLSGALLLVSVFIIFFDDFNDKFQLTQAAQELLKIHSSTPLFMFAIIAYLVGSLYVTALEGLVDWVHRKLLFCKVEDLPSGPKRVFLNVFGPLSPSARNRLALEAKRFYIEQNQDNSSGSESDDCHEFTQNVFADILWMEGKLTGTHLKETYLEYRAEGEFRLSIGLLLPLAATALTQATQTNILWSSIILGLASFAALQTCNYGLYYFKRAHSFLAHHVSDGSILTASMETLKRSPN